MICRHEFFKPGNAACARCGEPGRYPSSAMSRHTRVGAADSQPERWIADRVRPDGARARHAAVDQLWAIATREMRGAV